MKQSARAPPNHLHLTLSPSHDMASPSPSHDIRPPSSFSTSTIPMQQVGVCKRNYSSLHTLRVEPRAAFPATGVLHPRTHDMKAFLIMDHNSFNMHLFEIGKSGEFGFRCRAHLVSVRTVMVMAGGTCGARLSRLNWRVCAGLTHHYMGEGA